jgi:hypothetical protein
MFLENNKVFTNMNNNVRQKITSLKWEVKNTYFIMPVRRLCGGLEGLPASGVACPHSHS